MDGKKLSGMTIINMRAATLLEAAERAAILVGQELTGVLPADVATWIFRFGTDVTISVDAPWRATSGGRIVIGHEDHAQRFGISAPVNGADRLFDLLHGRRVMQADVNGAGDLTCAFGGETKLEIFNASCGYEGWSLSVGARSLVALGGGGFSIDA